MTVRVERDGPVVTVVLDRSERRNAIDRATADALADVFLAFEEDSEARVAVLWGAGGTFCAGADLHAIAEGVPNRVEAEGSGPLGYTRVVPGKPVIAAIEGHAVAGGLELACWADLRVASSDAVLGVFCRRWGVPLVDGGTVRLPRLVGLGRALDLVLTGRPVNAEEALRIGLVDRVVPPGAARATAEALAHTLAAFPFACLLADRAAVLRSFDLPFDDALRAEIEGGRAVLDEALAGAARFAAGAGRHGEGL